MNPEPLTPPRALLGADVDSCCEAEKGTSDLIVRDRGSPEREEREVDRRSGATRPARRNKETGTFVRSRKNGSVGAFPIKNLKWGKQDATENKRA